VKHSLETIQSRDNSIVAHSKPGKPRFPSCDDASKLSSVIPQTVNANSILAWRAAGSFEEVSVEVARVESGARRSLVGFPASHSRMDAGGDFCEAHARREAGGFVTGGRSHRGSIGSQRRVQSQSRAGQTGNRRRRPFSSAEAGNRPVSAALQIYSRDFDADFFKLPAALQARIELALTVLGMTLDQLLASSHEGNRGLPVSSGRL